MVEQIGATAGMGQEAPNGGLKSLDTYEEDSLVDVRVVDADPLDRVPPRQVPVHSPGGGLGGSMISGLGMDKPQAVVV